MKSIIIGSMVVAGLFAPQIATAQGTVAYLSNLGEPSVGGLPVAGNSWRAMDFRTGGNAGGYVLNSVQLAMVDASGNPSGFTVMLYSDKDTFGAYPDTSLATFSGSADPTTGGIYTYTAPSNLTLLPDTYYFIVLTAGTALADGAYQWSRAGSSTYNSSGGWSTQGALFSPDGSGWPLPPGAPPYAQFAINATPVPEPGILGLLGLGGLFFALHRRKSNVAE